MNFMVNYVSTKRGEGGSGTNLEFLFHKGILDEKKYVCAKLLNDIVVKNDDSYTRRGILTIKEKSNIHVDCKSNYGLEWKNGNPLNSLKIYNCIRQRAVGDRFSDVFG